MGPYAGFGPSEPEVAIYGLWVAWSVSWFAAALWSAPTAKRPVFGSEIVYRFVTVAGVLMLFGSFRAGHALPRLWPDNLALDWAMAALVAIGFLFCWWARIYLGRLWSGTVTKKAGHHVVDTGPYGIVRHPIYTGIILASYATAVVSGRMVALVGATVMLLGWYIKARLEERFLRAELDAQAYDAYAARVPMLIPFVKI